MAKDLYQISLKAIIVRSDGKILCLNGQNGGAYEGYYDLPGGRIEADEFTTPLKTILEREINEEVGDVAVDIESRPVSVGRHETKKEGQRIFYIIYAAKLLKDVAAVQISEEHEGFAWLDVNEENVEKYFISGILEGMKEYLKSR